MFGQLKEIGVRFWKLGQIPIVRPAEISHQSRTAWGPFFERKTRKMSPHGGWLKRDFMPVSDTRFQENAEFMYHQNA
jgi:hypothetical protein